MQYYYAVRDIELLDALSVDLYLNPKYEIEIPFIKTLSPKLASTCNKLFLVEANKCTNGNRTLITINIS